MHIFLCSLLGLRLRFSFQLSLAKIQVHHFRSYALQILLFITEMGLPICFKTHMHVIVIGKATSQLQLCYQCEFWFLISLLRKISPEMLCVAHKDGCFSSPKTKAVQGYPHSDQYLFIYLCLFPFQKCHIHCRTSRTFG